jgi:hypothetical protein
MIIDFHGKYLNNLEKILMLVRNDLQISSLGV